jgi:hypothetical protein
MRAVRRVLPAALALAVAASTARADEREACFDASAKAQKLKLERKLHDAQQQLLVCSRNECPSLIRQDCAQWMNEVLSSFPSVVVGARDSKGRDLIQVRVSVDGVVVTEKLEGKAFNVDPGVHTFKFEATGLRPIEQQVVVLEGEKNRPITVSFGGDGAKPPATETHDEPRTRADTTSSPPVLAYVIGGLGLVAVGVGAYFGLHSNSRAIELRDTCGKNQSCAQSDVDSISSERTAGWVTAGVGVAAIGVAIVLLVTHGSSSKTSGATTVVPVASPRGAGLALAF